MPSYSSLTRFYGSSIGKKVVVAVTGVVLFVFLAAHLAGNLLIFMGPEATNAYGAMLHGMPELLWVARVTLLVAVVLHIVATIQLTVENRTSRPKYAHEARVQTSLAARTMIVSGLIILCFVLYHLSHFTLHWGNDYEGLVDSAGRHDVYTMVVQGFRWWPASGFYILGMVLLCSHLGHGVASVFQTLGLATDRNWPLIKKVGQGYAIVLFVGFTSIPLAVLTGMVG